MNNLYRELAPISAAAWASLEDEAKRTFARHVAGRRVVDVAGPDGVTLAGVGTGHMAPIDPPAEGITAGLRAYRPVVELRVPFTLDREQIDSVERGALDPDWQPVKDAAKKIAFAEDRAVFDGYAAAQITGIREASSNPPLSLPDDVKDYPDAVSKAVSELRLAGVAGPDGEQLQIIRANMPFGQVGTAEFGTYYISYAATPSITEQMLQNMFLGDPPGNTDRILDFSTALTGCNFFAPDADFLDDPPGPPGGAATAAASAPGATAADGSLAIGSLKG